MTEVVQKRLELMSEEIEEMRRTKLFTIEETRIIFKKRKQYEHKIHAVTKDLKNYQSYIAYESCLLKDIDLRRNKYKIGEKKNSIEHRIIKRIKLLYELALQRFTDDLSLFLAFLKFCKKVNYVNAASDTVASMIKSHSHKPEVWKVAANWHMYDRKDLKTALVMLLKGVELHKDSKILYKEIIVIELFNVANNKDNEDTCLKRLTGVIESVFTNIKEPEFYIEILELLKSHHCTVDIQDSIIKIMTENYFDNENVWHTLAQREFKDKSQLNSCLEKYKEGLLKVTPSIKRKLWTLYLEFLFEMEREFADVTSTLKMALQEASEDKFLSERFYIAWLNLIQDELNLALLVTEKGITDFPHSVDLWNLHLYYQIVKDDPEKVAKAFKLGVKNLTESALPLWKAVIQYYQNKDNLQAIYEDGVKQPQSISNVLKPRYLNWLTLTKGIEAARQVYTRLSIEKPYCKEMHQMMIEMESIQPNRNYKASEKIHEIACQQFGKQDVDVWINYISFYLHFYTEHDNPSQRVNMLYNQAQQNLPKLLILEFLTKYSQIMND